MSSNYQHNSFDRKGNTFLIALLFIWIGVVILGGNMGWIPLSLLPVLLSWKLLLIAIGTVLLFRRRIWGGCILIGIGLYFLAPHLAFLANPYVELTNGWRQFVWPGFFILLGMGILLHRNKRTHTSDESYSYRQPTHVPITTESGYVISQCTFGTVQQTVLDPIFRGATIQNQFGGTILDLRHTKLEEPQTFIDIDCMFGGIEIYLPAEWLVKVSITPTVGGYEDKRYPMCKGQSDTTHVLIIRGKISFGGLELKN